MAFRDHLRPEEDGAIGRPKAFEGCGDFYRPSGCIRIQPDSLQGRHLLRQLALETLSAGPETGQLRRPALWTELRQSLGVATVMAPETLVPVQDKGNVAVRAAPRHTAGTAVDRRRDSPPVQEQDCLSTALAEPRELAKQRRGERVARLPAQVDDLDRRK